MARMGSALLALACGACGFHSDAQVGITGFDSGPRSDGNIGDAAPPDAPTRDPDCESDQVLGFTVSNIDPCLLPDAAPGTSTLNGVAIDTSTHSAAHAVVIPQLGDGAQEVLALRYQDLVIQGNEVLFHGSRPVVIVADTITIKGSLRVSAQTRTGSSPGADVDCGAGLGIAGDLNGTKNGYDGGSGGGFAADGGKGGEAAGGGSQKTDPGLANGNDLIVPLRGGCRGGLGGAPASLPVNITSAQSAPGSGGGAIQLIASTSIILETGAMVSAPGRGGGTFFSSNLSLGVDRAGGSGGGSGGAIFMEARDITVASNATIYAIGGAGGEGRDNTAGRESAIGEDAVPLGEQIRALGGSTPPQGGGDGGDGSDSNDNSTGNDGDKGVDLGNDEFSGGGGGGGGVGRTRLRTVGGTLVIDGDVLPPAREDQE